MTRSVVADEYETLRQTRLEGGWAGKGLALLMRQGMAAWLNAVLCTDPVDRRQVHQSSSNDTQSLLEETLQTEAVSVLTSMAVKTLVEENWL